VSETSNSRRHSLASVAIAGAVRGAIAGSLPGAVAGAFASWLEGATSPALLLAFVAAFAGAGASLGAGDALAFALPSVATGYRILAGLAAPWTGLVPAFAVVLAARQQTLVAWAAINFRLGLLLPLGGFGLFLGLVVGEVLARSAQGPPIGRWSPRTARLYRAFWIPAGIWSACVMLVVATTAWMLIQSPRPDPAIFFPAVTKAALTYATPPAALLLLWLGLALGDRAASHVQALLEGDASPSGPSRGP
jgi:hypothetical protein